MRSPACRRRRGEETGNRALFVVGFSLLGPHCRRKVVWSVGVLEYLGNFTSGASRQ